MARVIRDYDMKEFADDIAEAPANRNVGTELLFKNEAVKIWDLALEPGQRTTYHAHENPYAWVCVTGGRAFTRRDDGTAVEEDIAKDQARFHGYPDPTPAIHSLENTGNEPLRFLLVELLKPSSAVAAE